MTEQHLTSMHGVYQTLAFNSITWESIWSLYSQKFSC